LHEKSNIENEKNGLRIECSKAWYTPLHQDTSDDRDSQ